MTLKMQREDAVSGFSFLFPARYSPVEDAICPAGQPWGAGADPGLVLLQKSPREFGWEAGRGYSSRPAKNPPRCCFLPPIDIWYPGCQTQEDAAVPGMPK